MTSGDVPRRMVRRALERLGVDRLVLGIHEAALPSAPGIETGRGSLSSRGARRFLEHSHDLGFDGIQLGPSGMTGRGNPSPYDGTLFSRNLLSIDLESLTEDPAWEGLLEPDELRRLLDPLLVDSASRVPYELVYEIRREATGRATTRLLGGGADDPIARRLEAFVAAEREWLEPDAVYEALTLLHRSRDWRRWPSALDRRLYVPEPVDRAAAELRRREIEARFPEVVTAWELGQMIVSEQRASTRDRIRDLGLDLYGDLQVGMSLRDAWRFQDLFLPGYRLGAPPSRTNPEGQPWDYPVLHPELLESDGAPGPATRFLDSRLDRAFHDFDALRIDHPHGLVDPWVYRADLEDPYLAVQTGARLFSSPDDSRRPELGRWAIARVDQIDASVDPSADHRVRRLDEAQVELYGRGLERALLAARRAGRDTEDVVCEVLSTLPHPLERVMARAGLGRFRVSQKADPARPDDVYRPSNARPEDWVMLGNHDTPSIWDAIERWGREGTLAERAADTASRLARSPEKREPLTRSFATDPASLARGMLADLLASPARHVYVFFTDLFGIPEPYNRPGVTHPHNWTLRVPPDYRERLARGQGLDLVGACELALEARG